MARLNQPGVFVFFMAFLTFVGTAQATDISGTISTTLTITDNSKLVGDVTCTVSGAPCIAIGASQITIDLNGFTITGLADAQTGCNGPGAAAVEDGIDVNMQSGVIIRGPGVIQQFRRLGIRLANSTGVTITNITTSTNCFAGIIVIGGSNNLLDSNISVRNGDPGFPCGGI
jgi:hypothetical protein